ncbi:MAG: hypothetical protein JWO56_2695 [Acidobacteria bacterium]|nr:hypothetical protein [Acidobacteriota bacterium]
MQGSDHKEGGSGGPPKPCSAMLLERGDWLILLLALRDASESMDTARLQTGMFLLSQQANLPPESKYEFAAEDPGPFSATIYSDLAALDERLMVAREQVPGFSWSEFVLTEQGLGHAHALVEQMDSQQIEALRVLDRIKSEVLLSMSFRDLLDMLHRDYPQFASNSVFR